MGSELDEAAEWLDRLTKDRTARGRVTILTLNEVGPKPKYQTCTFAARIEAADFETVEIELEYMLRRDAWPSVGDIIPATVHLDRPERTEVDWERAPRRS
jgi:hypothetical protein